MAVIGSSRRSSQRSTLTRRTRNSGTIDAKPDAGSDERKQKATYPALHGLPTSKRRARELIDETKRMLEPLGAAADPIRTLADFVLERRS